VSGRQEKPDKCTRILLWMVLANKRGHSRVIKLVKENLLIAHIREEKLVKENLLRKLVKENLLIVHLREGKLVKENILIVHLREGKLVKETCQGKLIDRTLTRR
jgi:hypothetical protein